MRKLWFLVINDIRIFVRDPSALLVFLIMPIAITGVTGMALGNLFRKKAGIPTEFRIIVVDNDRGELARGPGGIVTVLEKSGVFKVIETYRKTPLDEAAARKLIQEGTFDRALIIPKGFSDTFTREQSGNLDLEQKPVTLTLVTDATQIIGNSVTLQFLRAWAERVSGVSVAVRVAVFKSMSVFPLQDIKSLAKDAAELTLKLWGNPIDPSDPKNPAPVSIKEEKAYSSQLEFTTFDQYIPGLTVMFAMFTCVLGAAVTLHRERVDSTLRRLAVSPVSRSAIIGSKLVANGIKGLVQITILFAFGWAAFKLHIGDVKALALISIAIVIAAVGLGMLVAVFTRTENQAIEVTVLVVLMMSALGGSWWPLAIEPKFMQRLGHLTVNAWGSIGLINVTYRGAGVVGVLPQAGVLMGMGLLFLIVAVRFFRFE